MTVTDASAASTTTRTGGYLSIRQITSRYAGGGGVTDVSLEVARGEMLVLLGPSGCGKTTLLRAIAGLARPDQGRIWLNGADVTDVPAAKRHVGMVFQTWALFPHLSVAENVAFGLKMRGVPKPDVAPRVAQALEMVRLGDFAGRYPRQLSGGQQQRVALARAFVTEPALLLLDEPLSALDRRIRMQLRTELRQLQRELGLTGVFVTHDHGEALALGDRVAVMDTGRIVEVGTPREIFTRPRHRYTASFLDVGNIIDVSLVDDAGDRAVLRTAFGSQVETAVPEGARAADVAAVCLAPGAVGITPVVEATATGADETMPGRIVSLEYEQATLLCGVRLDGIDEQVHSAQPVHRDDLRLGQQVRVSFDWSSSFAVLG
ncbi:ABC transporter ATP-binding protein [Phytohabitans kaempferiae]|uniref:ABC transporter ATP-binding protein n=1 Tax=Phytohabitans kaempferiae TaxID=1620943 RepID=A0ABV6M9Z5_9ACTN